MVTHEWSVSVVVGGFGSLYLFVGESSSSFGRAADTCAVAAVLWIWIFGVV